MERCASWESKTWQDPIHMGIGQADKNAGSLKKHMGGCSLRAGIQKTFYLWSEGNHEVRNSKNERLRHHK